MRFNTEASCSCCYWVVVVMAMAAVASFVMCKSRNDEWDMFEFVLERRERERKVKCVWHFIFLIIFPFLPFSVRISCAQNVKRNTTDRTANSKDFFYALDLKWKIWYPKRMKKKWTINRNYREFLHSIRFIRNSWVWRFLLLLLYFNGFVASFALQSTLQFPFSKNRK